MAARGCRVADAGVMPVIATGITNASGFIPAEA
jgi:hypothetical protein